MTEPNTPVVRVDGDRIVDWATFHDVFKECAAFVNWRRIEVGEPAVLALAFHK